MDRQPDKSVALLLHKLPDLRGNWLIVADENWSRANWQMVGNTSTSTISVFSNRFDIASSAVDAGLNCTFNDFDFCELLPQSFDGLLYRVSKERATSHHIINQAVRLLKPQGSMLLSGEKTDGIKTYTKQAGKLFNHPCNAEKHGSCYLASLHCNATGSSPLNDNNYPQLRPIETNCNLSLHSKPGIFGWHKIDRGSAFLVDALPQFLKTCHGTPQSLLDLGCGYGYLACCASSFGFTQITATDNNAAALAATAANFEQLTGVEQAVIAADAADQVAGQFDVILCNPPFHKGFAIDDELSVKFLSNSKRRLNPFGRALFVVNTFIPLEHKAKPYFDGVETLANNGSFKLVALSH